MGVGRDDTGHQSQVGFRYFAARVGKRDQTQIQRTFAQGRELGHGLHHRGPRVHGGFQITRRAAFQFLREPVADEISEIAAVAVPPRELMRDAQLRGGASASGGAKGRSAKRCAHWSGRPCRSLRT